MEPAQDMTKINSQRKSCPFCKLELQNGSFSTHFCQEKLNYNQAHVPGNIDSCIFSLIVTYQFFTWLISETSAWHIKNVTPGKPRFSFTVQQREQLRCFYNTITKNPTDFQLETFAIALGSNTQKSSIRVCTF